MLVDRIIRPVEARIRLTVHDAVPVGLWAWWGYQPRDPHAVHVLFEADEPVEWTLGRDLLAEGLHRPAGQGDVQLWPSRTGRLWLALSSPDGHCLASMPRHRVAAFLARTYAWVPRDQEADHVDLDAAVGRLLEGGK